MKLNESSYLAFAELSRSYSDIGTLRFLAAYKKLSKFLNDYRKVKMTDAKLELELEHCRKTIECKLWEECNCPSCKKLGMHMMLQRRGYRCRHIFFHNTYVQYVRFRKELKKAKEYVDYPSYNWSEIDKLIDIKTVKRKARR